MRILQILPEFNVGTLAFFLPLVGRIKEGGFEKGPDVCTPRPNPPHGGGGNFYNLCPTEKL